MITGLCRDSRSPSTPFDTAQGTAQGSIINTNRYYWNPSSFLIDLTLIPLLIVDGISKRAGNSLLTLLLLPSPYEVIGRRLGLT